MTRLFVSFFSSFWKDEVEKHERGGRASLVLALFKCIRWRLFLQAVVYVLVVSSV